MPFMYLQALCRVFIKSTRLRIIVNVQEINSVNVSSVLLKSICHSSLIRLFIDEMLIGPCLKNFILEKMSTLWLC